MLTLAKSLLRQILDTLRPEIAAGTPVVGLEPSCTAVFSRRIDEPVSSREVQAARATDVHTRRISRKACASISVPALHRRSVVHGHCHQKAIMKMEAECAVYGKMGLQWDLLGFRVLRDGGIVWVHRGTL